MTDLFNAASYIDRLPERSDKYHRAVTSIGKLRQQVEAEQEEEASRETRAIETAVEKAKRLEAQAQRALYLRTTNFIQVLPREVLVLIADHASEDNASFPVRMAGVSKEWRDVMLSRPSLWSTLVLSKPRPTIKVKVWLDRSNERLREVRFDQHFKSGHVDGVTDMLADYVSHVKTLTISSTLPILQPKVLTGAFKSLERFRYGSQADGANGSGIINLNIIDQASKTLRDVEIHHANFTGHRGVNVWQDVTYGSGLLENYDKMFERLNTVQTFRMTNGHITIPPSTRYPARSSRRIFMAHLKEAETITFNDVTFAPFIDLQAQLQPVQAAAVAAGSNAGDAVIELPKLKSYTEKFKGIYEPESIFERISAPNLTSLYLWDSQPIQNWKVIDELLAPGLEQALPHLQALDIGKTAIHQPDLLRVLKDLPSLRFLNVSYCGIDNAFLDAIQVKGGQARQRADAAASHGSVDRRTRYHHYRCSTRFGQFSFAEIGKDHCATTEDHLPRAPSMFMPTAPRANTVTVTVTPLPRLYTGTFKLSSSLHPNPLRPATSLSARRQLSKLPVSQFSAAFPLLQSLLPVNPRIDWLNIDHCNQVDNAAVLLWTSKVRDIHHNAGMHRMEDRIRGRGPYSPGTRIIPRNASGRDRRRCHLKKVTGL